MKQKTIKINLPNMSPKITTRQPLKNIINFTQHIPSSKQPIDQKKINALNSFMKKPQTVTAQNQKKISFTLTQNDLKQFNVNLSQRKFFQRNSLKSQKTTKGSEYNSVIINCQNHTDKLAKYKVLSDQIGLFYCQKCAVLLASQGFKVEKVTKQNYQNVLVNKFTKQSKQFLEEINQFLKNSQKIKIQNTEEKAQVEEYYESFIIKINDYEEELKRKVSTIMDKQRSEINQLFQQFKDNFSKRINQIQSCEQQLLKIAQDIEINIETITGLDQEQFVPIIENYKNRFNQYKSVVYSYEKIQFNKIQLLVPKPESLKSLSNLINECTIKIKVLQPNNNQNDRLDLQEQKMNMFFSFEKGIVQSFQNNKYLKINEQHEKMTQLDATVNIKMTNSDASSENDQQRVLQESIVDEDFSKLINQKVN